MKAWKISGSIVLILFIIVSLIISVRKVDGAGIVQTPQLKMVTLIIWGIFGLILLVIYLIWLAVLKRKINK